MSQKQCFFRSFTNFITNFQSFVNANNLLKSSKHYVVNKQFKQQYEQCNMNLNKQKKLVKQNKLKKLS